MSFEIEDGVLKKYIPENEEEVAVIPDSVTHIGEYAFQYCQNLTSVEIPDSVTHIGERAFKNCENLKSAIIPNSVTSIDECAFYYCTGLTSVDITDSVVHIDKGAFSCCTSLTSIEIPSSVTLIDSRTFEYCKRLTSVTIPDSVVSIRKSVFDGCKCLTSITIADSVTSIGKDAFHDCENLTPEIKGIKFKADGQMFSKDFWKAMKIIQRKDFSAKLYKPLKNAVIVGYYLQSGDTDAENFITRNFEDIFKFLIEEDNVGPIIMLLNTGKFVTAKNVLTFIDYANELRKTEIQLILMNYSHEHFGSAVKSKLFL